MSQQMYFYSNSKAFSFAVSTFMKSENWRFLNEIKQQLSVYHSCNSGRRFHKYACISTPETPACNNYNNWNSCITIITHFLQHPWHLFYSWHLSKANVTIATWYNTLCNNCGTCKKTQFVLLEKMQNMNFGENQRFKSKSTALIIICARFVDFGN